MTEQNLELKHAWLWALTAVVSFHLAWLVAGAAAFLMAVHLFCLLQLSLARTRWQAMSIGWAVGLLLYGPQLRFFWTVFGPGAIALWLVLAFWLRMFLLLLGHCRERFGAGWAALAAPVLWTGLEYFRSELYYLRFSWLIPGYAFAWSPALPALHGIGMYGVGFGLMSLAAGIGVLPRRAALIAGGLVGVALAVLTSLPWTPSVRSNRAATALPIVGVQLEFPGELEVLQALGRAYREHPEARLLVLSEYTFDGPVPDRVKNWCRTNRIHLLAGGKDYFTADQFRNTVFVIGPSGDVVFQQAKTQPIQFFKDGAPALRQQVWDSPWGRLGLCICYDLSYTRVVDELVRQGAQAILVPTMDVADWGEHQHRLHARVAPVRAAEYRLPIFRLASSGISQWVDARGRVRASAPFAGEGATLVANLELGNPGSRPVDRWLAPAASALTGALALWLGLQEILAFIARRRQAAAKS